MKYAQEVGREKSYPLLQEKFRNDTHKIKVIWADIPLYAKFKEENPFNNF